MSQQFVGTNKWVVILNILAHLLCQPGEVLILQNVIQLQHRARVTLHVTRLWINEPLNMPMEVQL